MSRTDAFPPPARPRSAALVRPTAPRVLPLLIVMAVATGALEALWLGVRSGTGPTALDLAVVEALAAGRGGWTTLTVLITDAGSPLVMSLLLLTVVAVLARRSRSWRPVAVGVPALLVVAAVESGVKVWVARPRPPGLLHAVIANGGSFPSGHASISAGVVLILTWLLMGGSRTGRRGRFAVPLLGLAFVVAVGASRLVLGVHYPSDVLAGWCLAVLCDGAVLLVVAVVETHRISRTPALHAAETST